MILRRYTNKKMTAVDYFVACDVQSADHTSIEGKIAQLELVLKVQLGEMEIQGLLTKSRGFKKMAQANTRKAL